MVKKINSNGKMNVKPLKRASMNWNLAKPRVKHRPGHRNGYRDAPVITLWKSDVAQHERIRSIPMKIPDATGDKERGALRAIMDFQYSSNEFFMSPKGESLRVINEKVQDALVIATENRSDNLFMMLEDM